MVTYIVRIVFMPLEQKKKNKLESHKKVCENIFVKENIYFANILKSFLQLIMPFQDTKKLEFN